jgi:hypothetical protein
MYTLFKSYCVHFEVNITDYENISTDCNVLNLKFCFTVRSSRMSAKSRTVETIGWELSWPSKSIYVEFFWILWKNQ